MVDALAYANTINLLTSDAELSKLANKMRGVYNFSTGTTDLNNQAKIILNKILTKTQIKRSCCTGNKIVNVRIPLPTGITPANDTTGQLIKKYLYYDKSITVPIDTPGFCLIGGVDYSKGNANCDDFYNVYCANSIKEFTAGNNNQFDDVQFNSYKPDCACYIPTPDWLKQAWGGEPTPKCVFPGCGENTAAYLDPASRGAQCNYTICSQQINMSDIQQGQNSNLINNIKAECGKQNKDPFVPASNPTTPTVPSGIPSTPTGPESIPTNPTGPTGPITQPTTESTQTSNNNIYLIGGAGFSLFSFCCLLVIIIIILSTV